MDALCHVEVIASAGTRRAFRTFLGRPTLTAMRTQLLIAAVVFAFTTAAQTNNTDQLPPYGWTSGLYAQSTDAAVMLFPIRRVMR